MQIYTSVIGCCGIVGFHGMPSTEKQFKSQVLSELYRNYGRYSVNGSHVMVSVTHKQKNQLDYLKKLGFKSAGRGLTNNNSGNVVTILLISRIKFNELLAQWRQEQLAEDRAAKNIFA